MTSASAQASFAIAPTEKDPYSYQVGFGNIFASEAVPGSLPADGRNVPQKCPFDLYSEHLNGTTFISSRATVQNVWMYRIRPTVAHSPIEESPLELTSEIEACFSVLNPKIKFTPLTYVWGALEIPTDEKKTTFVEGIKTMCGHGDPTQKEGVTVSMYAANASMVNQAFCNNDGNMLIVPQQGRLDIQTEMGRMMVRPGELCVIQAGIRFKVSLPDGPVRGYINEIFGTHWELPELGPIGANGMAHPRDFETPFASFDVDDSAWTIIHKLAGSLYQYHQNHTPFDVVSWHGNYAPYKYALEKFVPLACAMKEQCDPTIYCVLTSKSKIPGVSLSEFCVFNPKWSVAIDTYRPPYYHRTMATEVLGMIYGEYKGSVRELGPGHLSCENPYMAHGESYESWLHHTTRELKNEMVGEDTLQFMMHMSSHLGLTEFARKTHEDIKESKSGNYWEDIQPHFLVHLEQINKNLASIGRPGLALKAKGESGQEVERGAEGEGAEENQKEEKTGDAGSSEGTEEWQAVEHKIVTPPASE